MEHFPVWVKMRAHMRTHKSFGIYHETYKVTPDRSAWLSLSTNFPKTPGNTTRRVQRRMHADQPWLVQVSAGQYECIYSNMPAFGLGGAMGRVPVKGRYNTARGRAGETEGDDHPADAPQRPF